MCRCDDEKVVEVHSSEVKDAEGYVCIHLSLIVQWFRLLTAITDGFYVVCRYLLIYLQRDLI